MCKYSHIISLGFFCSVSLELDRMGLRDSSSPFDWLITEDIESVIRLIETEFSDFLECSFMLQNKRNRGYYYNSKCNLEFYHDFCKYQNFEGQIEKVKEKYNRRINRFYKNIKEPTLFVRYISSKNECELWEQNIERYLQVLKKFNPKNQVLLVSNDEITSTKLKIYNVSKDNDDSVARKFIQKNEELEAYLLSGIYSEKKRKINLSRLPNKGQVIFKKIHYKIKNSFDKRIREEYVHLQVYEKKNTQ